jgi:UDP-hydrolysing UDP-N-acetyl-D-glucosamine 2-epimerase
VTPSQSATVTTIAVVTGSRADYGLLRPVVAAIEADPRFELQLVVAAMHLSARYGLTVREIEADGLPIAARVETRDIEAATDLGLAFSEAVAGFTTTLFDLEPDLLLVLGDRHEILSAALAATALGIPIGHIHGGELSEGSVDDALRHCVTKLAHIHLVAARTYGERVCQLGERPSHVHVVGAPALDAIRTLPLLDFDDLGAALGDIQLARPLASLTLHPTSLDPTAASGEAREVIRALTRVIDGHGTIVLTLPNDDLGNRETREVLAQYAAAQPNVHAFPSLGQLRYLSLLRNADVMVGNSSSGLIEAPSFELPVVNVGDRQKGRLRAANVIDCAANEDDVAAAVERALTPAFRASLAGLENPYGTGDAASRILHVLANLPVTGLRRKRFFDVPDGPWRSSLRLGAETP